MTTAPLLQTIREGMESTIQGAFTTSGQTVTVYPFDVESTVFPRVVIVPDSPTISYGDTFGAGGMLTTNWIVEVWATAADPVSAQIQLAKLMGTGSLEARSVADALGAVRAVDVGNPTLNGTVSNIYVDTGTCLPLTTTESGAYIAKGELKVTVRTMRS